MIVEAKNSKGGLLALQFAVQPYLTKTDRMDGGFLFGPFFAVVFC